MRAPIINRLSSFTYLNVTQFLGALNDNLYKLLIIYMFIELEGIEYSHRILAVTGAIFVLPFLLFSASSGTLADRCSKRNIIALTKILEFITLAGGVVAFQYESKLGSYCVLFLMAALSAVFGPSKYGILPELVSTEEISKANGLMSSFTFLAIILGTFASSFILDITHRNFIFAGLCATFLAFIAMITSFCIEKTPPAGSSKRFNVLFISEIIATIKDAAVNPSLVVAIFGSAFFLFLAAFVQLNMIPFAIQALHLSDIQGGYLFLLTALGIGSGSLLAGKISGKSVELGLVPLAAFSIALSCFLLDLFSDQISLIIPLVILLGLCGGIYQIPLDSYIQIASPNQSRGQIVAATNFLSFFGVLCASALLYLISEVFSLQADKGFTIIGAITCAVSMVLAFQYFDYFTRFIGMVLSRLHFRTTTTGREAIPTSTPAIYVCTHTAWNDTLLMLGAQRHRMRFFIEQEQEHHRWMKRLYRLLRVVMIPAIEPLENHEAGMMQLKQILDRGISVCIFVENEDVGQAIEQLNHSYSLQQIKDATGYPIIPVLIEKGEKRKGHGPGWVYALWRKFRVPAAISFSYPK